MNNFNFVEISLYSTGCRYSSFKILQLCHRLIDCDNSEISHISYSCIESFEFWWPESFLGTTIVFFFLNLSVLVSKLKQVIDWMNFTLIPIFFAFLHYFHFETLELLQQIWTGIWKHGRIYVHQKYNSFVVIPAHFIKIDGTMVKLQNFQTSMSIISTVNAFSTAETYSAKWF